MPHSLRLVDTQLLQRLQAGQAVGIEELTVAIGVTATAIRQRLGRLLEAGLIQRRKVVTGRGRPSFQYQLTAEGQRYSDADAKPLAEAMWLEVLRLSDGESRRRILTGVAKRLGRSYAQGMAAVGSGEQELSLAEKMRRLAQVLASQQIASDSVPGAREAAGAEAEHGLTLPTLDIRSCPYPRLRDAGGGRAMCHLEEEIFSEALGAPVRLAQCMADGDANCHFVPVET